MCTDFRSASYSASQGKKVVVNSDIISYARTRTSSLSRRNWAPVMFCVRGSRNATVVSTVMGTEDVGCASGRIFEKIRVRLFSSIIEYPAPSRRGPIHIPEASFARTTGDGHVTTPLSLTHPSSKVGPPQHLRSHVNRLVLRDTPRQTTLSFRTTTWTIPHSAHNDHRTHRYTDCMERPTRLAGLPAAGQVHEDRNGREHSKENKSGLRKLFATSRPVH